MGSLARKSVLMICGDYMEDYETIVPFQALQAFGIHVDCVSPSKASGDRCFTAVHDYMGHELYTELQGHFFTLNSNFSDVKPESYNALIIPGGRFTELLSIDDKVLRIVTAFAEAGKPIATTCHSQLLLVAAGLMKGMKCTAFPSLKHVVKLAGGIWLDPEPVTSCVLDGNFISAIGWPAHSEYLSLLLRLMGAKVSGFENKAVLFLCGDYVEDYEINVPFQAMGGLGCRVDSASPSKKKGEKCVTAIHDFEGAQVCSEKSGHYFIVTSDWNDINVDDYDCLVIPGGRSPEYLVMDDKVVSMVRQFSEKDKVVSAIGQGKLVLVASGLLEGKRCASGYGMKAIVKVGGGEVVESEESVAHGKLLTATGWTALPSFISRLASLLGISIVF
ncbi:DJ-1 protein homolog E-like [Magnolia sinica]|uniref:DJ-1 protein homolog E-like n=1 Tax=Magnolia sinica TaxID=86752 RepID=UPI0026596CBB|nr:DJ-1 protein homolog E-like [Magnolia sinica]